MIKKFSFIILVLSLSVACIQEKSGSDNSILGSWAFLDRNGDYTEIHFKNHQFKSVNSYILFSPWMNYKVENDTLYMAKGGPNVAMRPIANIIWLDKNRMIFFNPYTRDTLERLTDTSVYLGNTDPLIDSARFMQAFTIRYDSFLVKKEIVSFEELKRFREEKIVPEDVRSQLKQK